MKNLFTTIDLSNGDKCEIVELTTAHLMCAINSHARHNEKEKDELNHLGVYTFIIQQIFYLKGARQSIDYFKSLSFADYSLILNSLSAQITDVPKFL